MHWFIKIIASTFFVHKVLSRNFLSYSRKSGLNFRPISLLPSHSCLYISRLKMSSSSSSSASLSTPSSSSDVIDKDLFNETLSLVALKIPAKFCTNYMQQLREHIFQRPRMKRIIDIPGSPDMRLLLLAETVNLSLSEFSPDLLQFIKDNGPGVPEEYNLKLGYDNLSVEEVLQKLLPQGSEIPSSFEQAGHIAHLNLRDEMLPFKHVIGKVILDKNPALKTVVNKMGNIENEFRTFPMEILAGEDELNVIVRESGARFSFNFRNVYWNSRLQTEHARLIQILATKAKKHSGPLVIADMMAGVGPFAVPLAMGANAITVHANDLNPESYASLVKNAKANHCTHGRLVAYNMDGREFIVGLVKKGTRFQEAIMNLPANATDFLDVFIGLETRYKNEGYADSAQVMPRIHVYGFSTASDPVADMADRVASILRCAVSSLNFQVRESGDDIDTIKCWGHIVRDVSPKKMMVCLSFTLPSVVANAVPVEFDFSGPSLKRAGTDISQDAEGAKKAKL